MHYMTHIVQKEEEDRQVLYLLEQVFHLTTTKIRSVKCDKKGILLDGERVTVRHPVREGQKLMVLLNDSLERKESILPADMPLEILYEDQDLLFLNKPAGIVCHPSQGHRQDSLANGVAGYFLRKCERSNVHLIGRLDKDTSGIVGIAKNGVTAQRMIAQRKEGVLVKEYLAVVRGDPGTSGDIRIPMEEYRDEKDGNKLKMRRAGSQTRAGRQAGTSYETIRKGNEYSLVKVTISTGRTHQIRFHMAEIGHPLAGDPLYGEGHARAALHAWKVTFLHPYTGEQIRLEVPIPEDMEIF